MDLLAKSINRMEVFDSYVSQLSYRWHYIKKHIANLEKQKINLLSAEKSQAEILARLKVNIRNSLKELNQFWATQNLDEYLELREKYTQTRVYLYFVTKFIDNYKNLQEYNKKLIKELKDNRDFIIRWEAIYLPKWDTKILKKYGLLIEDSYFNLDK
jgi:lysine/ornithine N-monooxygenase